MNRLVVIAVVLALTGPGLLPPNGSGTRAEAQSKPGAAPAPKSSTKPEDLDRLLAPIALYPDQLLAQILMSAENPGKAAALHEWLASNKSLAGSALQDAAVNAGFEPSFVALVLFPSVVQYMAEQLQWTTALGRAFTTNRSAVFDSIQRLRAQAQQVGKLKTTPQQEVETRTTSGGQQVIVIEPANPQVVYVPQYNPETVYTTPATTTVVVQEDDDDADEEIAAGLIGFTAGIAMGAAMDNDYYYGPYGWGGGGAYMYNDAWDDYYDHREDAREDWADHREDISGERTDRARTAQEQRTERTEARTENRPQTAQTEARRSEAQSRASEARASGATTQGARGYSSGTQATKQRSGTSSDAFSGYSSGKSERSASQRGQQSRSSASRGGGGGSRGGGGGRRR